MFKNFNRIVTTILKRGIQANVAPREDFNFVPIGRSAQVSIQDRFVCVEMENGEAERIEYKYPSIWLRDNCQCSSCYHLASKSRIINWQEKLNYNLLPKSVKLDGKLRVVWNDNHSSDFELDWLQARSFNVGDREKYLNKIYRPRPRLWSKTEFDKFVEHFKYDDIVSTRQGLRKWLQSLAVNGCAFIHDAPQSENACRQIANLVGFIKKTHYGEEFIVRARESTNNAAYLSAPLQMHTDLPYYEYKPGVSLLHCLVQSKSAGAANLLVDGFYVAERMRMEHPDFYRILTSTLVNWSDYGVEEGNEFEKVYRAPVIGLDFEGKLNRITQSVPQRDSFFSIPPEQADEWYRAMLRFVDMLYEESVSFKTKPGDILTFSNIRLLHGRTGYQDVEGNTRHLVGAFIDWDEIYSRLRVLTDKA